MLDGWIGYQLTNQRESTETDDDSDATESAKKQIMKAWSKLLKCDCCQSLKSAVVDHGTEEYALQRAAREDVLLCVMKGIHHHLAAPS